MKISKAIGATAALGLLAAGFVAAPAQADTVGTVTVHMVKRADNGHGTPAHWADDTWDRTATITTDADGTYTVTLSGSNGSFVTVDGAGSPEGGNANVTGGVKGDFTESLTATVTDATPKSKGALANMNGDTIHNGADRASAQGFIKHLFKDNAATVTTTDYEYTYSTGCEKWTDSSASDNNDGQGASAGTITGQDCTPAAPVQHPSKLTAANKCRASASDKRNFWVISNSGPRVRTYWLHVSYGGKAAYEGEHSVAANSSATVRTSHGGKLKVGYYDGYAHHMFAYAWSNAKVLCK